MKRLILILLCGSLLAVAGCWTPQAIKTSTIAARVDARVTLREIKAMTATQPATSPAEAKAMIHLQTIADLLAPAEASFRGVKPEQVQP